MTTQNLAKLLDEKLKPIAERLSVVEKRMATKDDISNMATKDDISNMATKDDLKSLATKKQFAKLNKKLDKFFDNLDREEMKTQKRVDNLEGRVDVIEEQVATTLV